MTQTSLFDVTDTLQQIEGLYYVEEFMDADSQEKTLSSIYSMEWDIRTLARRVQQYGIAYDYHSRDIGDPVSEMPGWLVDLAQSCQGEIGSDLVFNQCIINEYTPGQGIGSHCDHPKFGPVVCTLSLESDIDMDFSHQNRHVSLRLKRGSLLALSGPARSQWRHGIKPRSYDMVYGYKVPRQKRVSVTFRTCAG